MEKKEKTIGMKELYHNLSGVAREVEAGRTFVVLKHAHPVFRIEPMRKTVKKTYTLADLAAIRFQSNDRNLSKKIDHIV